MPNGDLAGVSKMPSCGLSAAGSFDMTQKQFQLDDALEDEAQRAGFFLRVRSRPASLLQAGPNNNEARVEMP